MDKTSPDSGIAGRIAASRAAAATFGLVLLLLLAVTRWPLAPKYLYYFDSVNFALALNEFDPSQHQPQPPGYPLFVGVMKLVHFVVPRAEDVLIASGVLVGAAALMLVWRVGTEMFGPVPGFLASALLIFNPCCWLGGITNQVRLCLALCSAGVALLAWRALREGPGSRWFYAAFFALGIAAGFRPTTGILLIPLLLWVWWRTGGGFLRLLAGGMATLMAATPWIAVTAAAVGGLERYIAVIREYSDQQFSGTSALFGASAAAAILMAKQAIVWNGLGVLTWIWAVPFAGTGAILKENRSQAAFLLIWFLPAFLFSAAVHIGDPDQALFTVAAICVAGGAVLGRFLALRHRQPVLALAGLVALLNAGLFFVPPVRLARAAGYRAVASIDERLQLVFRRVNELRGNTPVSILHHQATVTWRHLAYYFPTDYVVYLPEVPGSASWTLLQNKATDATESTTKLPGTRRVIVLAPFLNPQEMAADGWLPYGPLFYRDLEPGSLVRVGPYKLLQPAASPTI